MQSPGHSVPTTPEGVICEDCLDSPVASGVPVRRLPMQPTARPDCQWCGDPVTPEFGPLDEEDLDY